MFPLYKFINLLKLKCQTIDIKEKVLETPTSSDIVIYSLENFGKLVIILGAMMYMTYSLFKTFMQINCSSEK